VSIYLNTIRFSSAGPSAGSVQRPTSPAAVSRPSPPIPDGIDEAIFESAYNSTSHEPAAVPSASSSPPAEIITKLRYQAMAAAVSRLVAAGRYGGMILPLE
jgi:hypothetical protein